MLEWASAQPITVAILLALSVGPVAGGDKKSSGVATCLSSAGTSLQRTADGSWSAIKPGASIPSGALLVSLPRTELQSANKAVGLNLVADIGHRGPYPVLESAVVLHQSSDVDLELTVDRGIVSVTNLKKQGAAKVRLHIAGDVWELLLKEPQTKVGLELFGRHPPGAPKILEGKVEPPTADLIMLVLKGEAFLQADKHGYALHAPPGLAKLQWDNVLRQPAIQRLETLPDFVTKLLDEKESKVYQEVCERTRSLGEKPLAAELENLLKSEKKTDRLVGATLLGGIDHVPGLLAALADPKHADVRGFSILVLRNWMGRGPGQVEKLYQALTQDGRYSKVHARTILQLLFGFHEEDRSRPDTYELLIALLGHDQLPVRELARWHLVRLASAGKEIDYDAAAAEAQRQKAVNQWRALIPAGRLPPSPKVEPPSPKR